MVLLELLLQSHPVPILDVPFFSPIVISVEMALFPIYLSEMEIGSGSLIPGTLYSIQGFYQSVRWDIVV